MVAIIIATHGEAAPELKATAEMILGPTEGVHTVTFNPGQGPEDLIAAYETAAADAADVLLLVDLFGGSPYNAGARFVAARDEALGHEPGTHADVVAGVNVPMIMEVLGLAKKEGITVEKLVTRALKAGSTGVRAFRAGKAPVKTAATGATGSGNAQASAAAAQPVAEAPTGPITDFPRDPNVHMDVAFMRIDSRLIHGQVAGAWVGNIQPQTLIAASDNAAGDALRKELLLQVGPASARTNVLDLAKTVRVFYNPDYQGMKTMIVVETPQDALALIREGVVPRELNVGGVTYKDGMVAVSEAVYTNDEQVAAYQEINKLGVPMVLQQVPNSPRVELMGRLKEKGLLK